MTARKMPARPLWMGAVVVPLVLSATATPASTATVPSLSKSGNHAEFIYAANQAAENVSGYRIDLKNGKLVGTRRTKDVTKDEVLGMIIMGKLPEAGRPI